MRSHVRWLLMGLLCLVLVGCSSRQAAQENATTMEAPAEAAPRAAEADVLGQPQPELAAVIDNAAYLLPDDLGPAGLTVDPPSLTGSNVLINPDGKSWDVVLWYRLAYTRKTRIHVLDLGTMQVSRQDFKDEEGHVRMEIGLTWWPTITADGTLYGANTDTNTGALNIYRYNAGANRVEKVAQVPGAGGERNGTALSPNGWIYGTSTWLTGPDAQHKVAAYGFNPATGEVKIFGNEGVGPRIKGAAYGYTMGCDDTHMYIACGQIPWYLLAIDLKTGEETVLAEAPEGGAGQRMGISTRYGGAEAYVQQADDAPRQNYWLYHGKAIPKTEGAAPPWGDLKHPFKPAVPEPEVHLGDTYPDENGRARLWWRPEKDKGTWQSVTIEGVEKHPVAIHRLVRTEDGRLWGTTGGYRGRFLYDPKTGQATELGGGGDSIYAVAVHGGKVYWSGYPSAPIWQYDPNRPWTLERVGPPGTKEIKPKDADSNPRLVHDDHSAVFLKTRVKKMLSAAVAADGKVYFGGKGMRDYIGGGLSWYDPNTGQIGGLWEPFNEKPIGFIAPAVKGRYIVASTAARKVFVFDTQTGQVVSEFEPVSGAAKGGPLLEVSEGLMIGTTGDPVNKQAGVIYGVRIPSGEVVFRKSVPYALQFTWAEGTDPTDFARAPDGSLWTYLGNALVRINPRTARVDVLGKMYEVGTMCFDGDDLYVTGTTRMRRFTGIVAKAGALARRSVEAAAKAAPVASAPAGAPRVQLELEAETGTLWEPTVAVADANASGGRYLASDTDRDGMATFSFEVPAPGEYVIWARVLGPSASSDSFFIIMDNGTQDTFDTGEVQGVAGRWHWLMINGRGSGGPLTLNPRVFPLSAGKHRLTVRCREPNARLDKLVITNDREYKPE